MNPSPRAVPLEPPKTVIDRDLGREVMRQLPPRATRAHHIEDSIDHLAHIRFARASARLGRRDRRFDQSPLTVRHVGRVWLPFHVALYRPSTDFLNTF